ncbi:MAG: hypothetical protein V3W31_00650, partial [Thermodesulfobacteriota bacterium]
MSFFATARNSFIIVFMATRPLRTYLAIYLVSTGTLTYEIGLMNLFSLAQGYHFAFMVISIALMGIGAGGAVLMATGWSGGQQGGEGGGGEGGEGAARLLSVLAALLCAASVLCYMAANALLFDPVKAAWSRSEFGKILAQYLMLSIPFVFSGAIVSAAIRAMSERVHRLYLADMVGAGTGCVLILLVLTVSGGEGAVIVAAFLFFTAALLFRTPSRLIEAALPASALILLALAAFLPGNWLEARVSPYRDLSAALNFPGGRVLETVHSPSGRLDVVES